MWKLPADNLKALFRVGFVGIRFDCRGTSTLSDSPIRKKASSIVVYARRLHLRQTTLGSGQVSFV